ncbi:low molecular weight protein arginine phosphatase [Mahella australiensis]|uniref:Protein tyrosine phosphatase n=1 Tax=Mahella australiensis (strain DSM 15567 / CIP 107919 / 50-1 BON) TaxID=697281 RepID=F3ZVB7_MAHA5|nr:low molecular weight protein arginine phosphatase [Mahella australiensis]AEE95267.1 protein tyrosine phosphatase [Mahella australiensis 50-1 BON]
MISSILFVCSGNTCRSPMAQAIAETMFRKADSGLEAIKVMSAGIAAVNGQPASANAIEVMREMGMDISRHRSRMLSGELVEQADLILTMTLQHKRYVLMMFPESYDKVFTLKEYADCGSSDIPDPFGGSLEDYRECANEIQQALFRLVQKLKQGQ